MWQCPKCNEELEDSFDACSKCGTSKDGTENPDFRPETDTATSDNAVKTSRHWNGFWAGAVVTAVVGYINFLVPSLIALPSSPVIRKNLGAFLAVMAVWSLLLAGGGGIAGWIGSRTNHIGGAACRGAFILLVTQTLMILFSGILFFHSAMPLGKTTAFFVNISALGAIAASVGRVVGRPRNNNETIEEPIQYSISDILFLTLLFSILFASLAILSR